MAGGWSERVAQRAWARATSELRTPLVGGLATLGPTRFGDRHTGGPAVVATRGIGALDGQFPRCLPQWPLRVIVAALVPDAMGRVGSFTTDVAERQMHRLHPAGRFLVLVHGFPTLKALGRAKAQPRVIGGTTEEYRRAAMATLRVTSLPALVLASAAAASVAPVATVGGIRLPGEQLDLRSALSVLVLAREPRLSLRLLGSNCQDSAEGMRAAAQLFSALDEPLPRRATIVAVPTLTTDRMWVDRRQVTYPIGPTQPPADPLQPRPGGGAGGVRSPVPGPDGPQHQPWLRRQGWRRRQWPVGTDGLDRGRRRGPPAGARRSGLDLPPVPASAHLTEGRSAPPGPRGRAGVAPGMGGTSGEGTGPPPSLDPPRIVVTPADMTRLSGFPQRSSPDLRNAPDPGSAGIGSAIGVRRPGVRSQPARCRGVDPMRVYQVPTAPTSVVGSHRPTARDQGGPPRDPIIVPGADGDGPTRSGGRGLHTWLG